MKTSSWNKLNKRYDWLYFHEGVFNFEMFEKFVNENCFIAVSKKRTTTTLKWFLENGKDVGNPNQYDRLTKCKGDQLEYPLDDHDYYFKYPSGECVYVSQPYVSKETAEPIVMEYAKTHGVKTKVYDGSYAWYNPKDKDKICFIVIALPNRNVKVYSVDELKSTAETQTTTNFARGCYAEKPTRD